MSVLIFLEITSCARRGLAFAQHSHKDGVEQLEDLTVTKASTMMAMKTLMRMKETVSEKRNRITGPKIRSSVLNDLKSTLSAEKGDIRHRKEKKQHTNTHTFARRQLGRVVSHEDFSHRQLALKTPVRKNPTGHGVRTEHGGEERLERAHEAAEVDEVRVVDDVGHERKGEERDREHHQELQRRREQRKVSSASHLTTTVYFFRVFFAD